MPENRCTATVFGQIVAEEVGFEPTEPCGSPVFKTGAFDQLCYSSPLSSPETPACKG